MFSSEWNYRKLGEKDLGFVLFLALKDFANSRLKVTCWLRQNWISEMSAAMMTWYFWAADLLHRPMRISKSQNQSGTSVLKFLFLRRLSQICSVSCLTTWGRGGHFSAPLTPCRFIVEWCRCKHSFDTSCGLLRDSCKVLTTPSLREKIPAWSWALLWVIKPRRVWMIERVLAGC